MVTWKTKTATEFPVPHKEPQLGVENEPAGTYIVDNKPSLSDDEIIEQAKWILRNRMRDPGPELTSPDSVRDFLTLQLAERECEVFGVLYLDNRHRLIEFEEMFRGTIDGASVHPREVVKAALAHNAAAVIFAHNHPSGVAEASQADIKITALLKEALTLIDIRVLDHIIVGDAVSSMSFAERGLL